GPARFRAPEPAEHPVAAPPGRLRLQRLVAVPDPEAGHRAARSRAAGLHQVGRRGIRGAGPEHGIPTVSMPGVAAWQAPWADKNDALDWQAYYHLRNRIVTALLHSPADHGGALLSESLQRQLQNLLSMQYSTAALRLLAIEDVLTGPAHLHRDLLT